ncbi:MAG: sialidase [Planctomycetota bacterium]|nr:MAG: sialidase [Planctomycetota bacterium]REK24540.1 MAG: sialidase [Planctomycetota bacterium]REK28847.1 MAG: sialidase [Planctomycetota bacterium]
MLSPVSAADPLPEQLKPHFGVPDEYQGELGEFRSVMKFDDGSRVENADDWPRRREEIRKFWMNELGPWPELITRPRVEVLTEENKDGVIWKRIRIGYAPDQTPEGWLLVPEGDGPFPAVLVVFYEPETSVGLGVDGKPPGPHRDFGIQLAKRGFVTLNIGTPGGDAYQPEIGDARCQPLSFHAYVSANCWHALAAMPEVDPERIGITGHSYGGKWSMFSAALWDKFAAVAVSDPGIVFDETNPSVNYWEPWYLGLDPDGPTRPRGIPSDDRPRTGAYKRLVESGHDLHELHALIAPRPFLVSGGSEDPPHRWIPLNHTIAVNELLGYENRIGLTSRPMHSPTAESNAVLFAFFEHFLAE